MKRTLLLLGLCLILAIAASAQKLPKPTQLAAILSPEQQKALSIGTGLHDAKKFKEAIAIYDAILKESPDATVALYEKALSQYASGDLKAAMDTAYAGAKYKCEELAMFYSIIANCLDDVGKSNEAIGIYRQAESIFKGDVGMKPHLSSVYFNLGITYMRLKKPAEAKTEFKNSIEANPLYPSPHYMLSRVFASTNFKFPSVLAASRFVPMGFNTERGHDAARVITAAFRPPTKDAKGNITINLDINSLSLGSSKEEGDFGSLEVLAGISGVSKTDKEDQRTTSEVFADSIRTFTDFLIKEKKLRKTFVGTYYIPYFEEMNRLGYIEAFAYVVSALNGDRTAEAWLSANKEKVNEYIAWGRSYTPSEKKK